MNTHPSGQQAPLANIRVLDLTRLLPGSYATQILAQLGAEVIKVEDPANEDYTRTMPPLLGGMGLYFMATSSSKQSITLNLKTPGGISVFRRLASQADVIIESFRPGVMDRLGIRYQTLYADNPRLVYCAVSGFGQEGPYSQQAGHDLNYAGYSGLLHENRDKNHHPVLPPTQLNDLSGAFMAVTGILAALLGRAQSGEGRFIDTSMVDSGTALMPLLASLVLNSPQINTPEATPLQGSQPCYNVYETRDGKYITFCALEPKFWINFCNSMNRPDLLPYHLPVNKDHLQFAFHELRAIFLSRTSAEWLETFAGKDTCIGPVYSLKEAFADPHMQDRELVKEVHLNSGESFYTQRFIPRISDTDVPVTPPPVLGQHTEAVLQEAGFSAEEIAGLRRNGAIQ